MKLSMVLAVIFLVSTATASVTFKEGEIKDYEGNLIDVDGSVPDCVDYKDDCPERVAMNPARCEDRSRIMACPLSCDKCKEYQYMMSPFHAI